MPSIDSISQSSPQIVFPQNSSLKFLLILVLSLLTSIVLTPQETLAAAGPGARGELFTSLERFTEVYRNAQKTVRTGSKTKNFKVTQLETGHPQRKKGDIVLGVSLGGKESGEAQMTKLAVGLLAGKELLLKNPNTKASRRITILTGDTLNVSRGVPLDEALERLRRWEEATQKIRQTFENETGIRVKVLHWGDLVGDNPQARATPQTRAAQQQYQHYQERIRDLLKQDPELDQAVDGIVTNFAAKDKITGRIDDTYRQHCRSYVIAECAGFLLMKNLTDMVYIGSQIPNDVIAKILRKVDDSMLINFDIRTLANTSKGVTADTLINTAKLQPKATPVALKKTKAQKRAARAEKDSKTGKKREVPKFVEHIKDQKSSLQQMKREIRAVEETSRELIEQVSDLARIEKNFTGLQRVSGTLTDEGVIKMFDQRIRDFNQRRQVGQELVNQAMADFLEAANKYRQISDKYIRANQGLQATNGSKALTSEQVDRTIAETTLKGILQIRPPSEVADMVRSIQQTAQQRLDALVLKAPTKKASAGRGRSSALAGRGGRGRGRGNTSTGKDRVQSTQRGTASTATKPEAKSKGPSTTKE